MACNSCSRAFSLLRPEKGCPSCGFSYCSKCLNNKKFLAKVNAEKKVCAKCSRNETKIIEPPDVFYSRIAKINESQSDCKDNTFVNTSEQEIFNRLQKLKQDKKEKIKSDKEILERLQNLKGPMPSTSDAEIYSRLAEVKGIPNITVTKEFTSEEILNIEFQPVLSPPDLRTEQEQADDLLKQYMEQTKIDSKYKDGFEDTINNIETRLHKLRGTSTASISVEKLDSEDEETIVKKIIEKVRTDASLEDEISTDTNDELPFCEICNEDARVRCIGCKYLFCMRCFNEHKDDDDGCDTYEIFSPLKSK
ncbi:unnamed protein product [Parnassius apollo]|uniref:(apollo) hypothetical protein n=1 Tax=Parnassius apollo TaxID=110799 RepID=A0A8S3WEY8_PARAO|nr:unnamed protein product [Parnassius apollo]